MKDKLKDISLRDLREVLALADLYNLTIAEQEQIKKEIAKRVKNNPLIS